MEKVTNNKVHSYTWLELAALCSTLVKIIRTSSFQPEVIIGISRGGCFPALLLSHQFGIRDLYTISVKTTVDDSVRAHRQSPEIQSVYGIPRLTGKKVLLVDDVTNTGVTLLSARRAVESLSPGVLKLACPIWDTLVPIGMHELGNCPADYIAAEICAWAKFPWEVENE